MTDSTRRALRTAYQFVVALVAIVPLVLAALPEGIRSGQLGGEELAAILGVVIACHAFATKLINALEDAGRIPAWLKAPASDGAKPVPNDRGAGLVDVTLVLLCIALVIWIVAALR